MPELATGWISISARTDGIPAAVQQAFNGTQQIGNRAGQQAGQGFSSGLLGGLKKIGPALGIAGGLAGLAAGFTSVVSTGNNFTSSMNTMRAVSSASAEEMSKVSAAARQLANDTSLPATSATDAAAAMVELAKGGFTVEQSMQAARGTLQLAAAAQIDAASAATIQSQALQAFGQNASYAGTAADILANAANASSAEITDVSAALQQSGTVANQFGLSMQDTAAAIAMMANAGIQGSDAGTLLKSALLALTDQGNPAQGAIEELGLTVYDAQGKFVGLSKLFGELETASKSMSSEQYQAATATLFGSDAMRIAGIAAQQGSEGYDSMVAAMGRQGSAAEVAAARTEGLPGAWERLKNAVESASLSMYDVISGPLTGASDGAADLINSLQGMAERAAPAVGGFFKGIGENIMSAYETLQQSGKIEEWGNRLSNIWNQISEAASKVGPIILQFSSIAAKAAAAMGFAAWEGLLATLESLSTILTVGVVPILELLADVMGASETATIGLVAAFLLFKTVPAVMGAVRGALAPLAGQARAVSAQLHGLAAANRAVVMTSTVGAVQMGRFGSAIATVGRSAPVVARMQQSFVNAAAGANQFGRTAGAAAAAGTGLRSAGAGLAGVFGGPVGLGLTAAAIGGMAWMSSVQKQKAATDAYKAALESMNEEQTNTASLLTKTRGAASAEVYSSLTKQVDDYRSSLEAASTADAKWTDNVADGVEKIFTGDSGNTSKKLDEAATKARQAQEALEKLGITSSDVGAKIGGSAGQWTAFENQLRGMGEGGRTAADELEGLRNKFLEQQNIAKMTTPGITDMQNAMRILADETASAADKTNALKSALDALNPARTKGEALAEHNEIMRDVADATKEAWDQTQGFGGSLGGIQGVLNGTTANGSALREELLKIVDATAAAKANNADMGDVNAKNAESFKLLAQQAGIGADEVKRIADELGLADLNLIIKASGGNETIQQLASVKKAFDEQPGTKTINMEMGQITPETEAQLESFGYKVNAIPGSKMIQIEATDGASPMLQAVLNKVIEVGGMEALPKIDANASQFFLKDEEARNRLRSLDLAQAYPEVGVTIDKLLSGSNISMAELQKLDQTVANPQAKMEIAKILEALGIVNTELDRVASPRTAFIDTVVRGTPSTGSNGFNVPGGGMGPPAGANGFIRSYADGGLASYGKGAVRLDNPHIRQGSGAGVVGVSKAGPAVYAEGETDWEAFIPGSMSKRGRATQLLGEVARRFGYGLVSAKDKLQAFANGGIRGADFDKLAEGGFGASRPLQGAPYDWAGVNWGDCSGAMSAFARLAAGLPIWSGRFATASMAGDLASMGAQPGKGSSGDLQLGWYNGGEGGGHTAGTLPSGKPVEMGGPHGGGAYGQGQGANNPNFTDFAHFKVGPSWTDPGTDPGGNVIRPDGTYGPVGNGDFSAGGSGGIASSSEQSPEQKLSASISENFGNAAKAAVSGQISDALGVFNLPDSPGFMSAASILQENNPAWSGPGSRGGAQAQPSVADPGTSKPKPGEDGDPAGTGFTSPQAAAPPALGFTPTGDEIKDAVKRAFAPKSWADGAPWDATDFIVDKESTWNPLARNASSGAFGLFQFLGATKDQYLPDENPDPFIQGEAGAKYIADRYGDPRKAKVFWDQNGWYDNGGILPTGKTLVTNNTGKPEAILNPAQWDVLKANASNGGGENHYHFEQINHQPVYRSESEAQQRYTKFQRRQMMRYGG